MSDTLLCLGKTLKPIQNLTIDIIRLSAALSVHRNRMENSGRSALYQQRLTNKTKQRKTMTTTIRQAIRRAARWAIRTRRPNHRHSPVAPGCCRSRGDQSSGCWSGPRRRRVRWPPRAQPWGRGTPYPCAPYPEQTGGARPGGGAAHWKDQMWPAIFTHAESCMWQCVNQWEAVQWLHWSIYVYSCGFLMFFFVIQSRSRRWGTPTVKL